MIQLPVQKIRKWAKFNVFMQLGNKWIPLQTMGTDPGSHAFSEVTPSQLGIYVADVAQMALPSFGFATLIAPIGNINTVNHNFEEGEITAPDIKGKQIYITVKLEDDETPRTVFWGVVDYQKDVLSAAGDPYVMGQRIYKASDLLYWVTSRATMNQHGYAFDGLSIDRASGMPNYNGRNGRPDLLQGNKAIHLGGGLPVPITNLTEPILIDKVGPAFELRRFTFDGLGGFWSDKEVVVHAIHTGQINNHLIEFAVDDVAGLLDVQDNTWPVQENERAWTFITKILRFQRGAGISYFTFDTNSDGSPKDPTIRVHPIHTDDIDVLLPEDLSMELIQGAITSGTVIEVDLVGDHRHMDSFFSLGGIEDFKYDRIEVTGEKIQVLCQLAFIDNNLIKLWSDEEQTDFDGLDPDAADPNRHDHIYRLFGVPRDWNGVTGNGDGGVGEVGGIYFFCDDAGVITPAGNDDYLDAFASPSMLKILPDIPLHNGIDPLTGLRFGGLGSASGVTMRGRILTHERIGTDSYQIIPAQHRLKSDGIWIGSRGSDALSRLVGSTDMKTSFDKTVVTCCIELPSRVLVARGEGRDSAEKTKRIRLSGAELWIGANGAMFAMPDVDSPLRFASRTLLRDDRNRIANIAYLAEYWYIKPHRAAKWGLKDFGIGGSFEAIILSETPDSEAQLLDDFGDVIETTLNQNLKSIDYPKIGELVTTLKAAGSEQTINAPITSVRYDNRQGATFWQCDWGELEL